MLVICERASQCNNSRCNHIKPIEGVTITDTICTHARTKVSVVEVMTDKTNPNYQFRRMKNELRSR